MSLSDKIKFHEKRWNKKPYAHFIVKDVKEFIRELKEKIDENLEENRKTWKPTEDPSIAGQRLMIAKLHTDIIDEINESAGEKLT